VRLNVLLALPETYWASQIDSILLQRFGKMML